MTLETHRAHVDHDAPNAVQEPLPPFKFMFLAREIRNTIYTLALSASSPIIVWKGEWITQYHDPSRPYTTLQILSNMKERSGDEASIFLSRKLVLDFVLQTFFTATSKSVQKLPTFFIRRTCLLSLENTIGTQSYLGW